jgi:membrane peptidoglycan carboxypeptidase
MRPLPLYLLLQRRHRRLIQRGRSFEPRLGQIAWLVGLVMVLVLAVGALLGGWLYASLTSDLPPITRLPTLLNPDDGLLLKPTRLYDRTGAHLLMTLQDPGAERRYLGIDPQKPDHFSPFLIQTVIGVEEPAFWQDSGVAWQHLTDPQAYTIAERVVAQLLLPDEPQNLRYALRMRLLAGQLVSRYGRAQVLEWRLNSAYFGRLAYGAESAARLYFGKSAADLNLAEAALLAGVIQAPALNPLDASQAALERKQNVLALLLKAGQIEDKQYALSQAASVEMRSVPPASPQIAPAFISLALDQLARRYGRSRLEMGGLEVNTSLDYDLQRQLTCTLQAQLSRAEGRPSPTPDCPAASLLPSLPADFRALPVELQGSAVLLDVASGQVLAMTGDSTSFRESAASSGHAPGTLLTPLLAVSAFSRGFGPASLVWDIPGQLTGSLEKITHPTGKYIGPLSLRQALVSDDLSPLQTLLDQLGSTDAWQLSGVLGLAGLAQSENPGQLLFKGGNVRLLDAAQAYATIANQGVRVGQRVSPSAHLEPVTLLRVSDDQGRQLLEAGAPESQPVLSAPLAYLVHNLLSDEPSRWPSLGHPNLLEIGRPAGAKASTTLDGRQTWTAGYTPQRLVITWLGLPSETSADAAADVRIDPNLAAGVWHALIQYASRDLTTANWSMPAGVSRMDVCSPSGLLPTRACPTVTSELFLDGNEPTGPDTLYRTFQVNRETGQLATVFTPPELVEERTFLVLPEEAQSWGKLAGLPVPPQDYDRIQPPVVLANVQIANPAQFSVVRGAVAIQGTAAGDGFSYYQLQAGQGLNPQNWLPVGDKSSTSVKNGTLGLWDTGKENGLFAVRLQVVRQGQRLETAILQVTVDNTPPRLRILSPLDGQTLAYSAQPITFQADVSDAVGLQRVEFWVDGKLIDTRSSPPFSLAWPPQHGSHTLKLVAYDLAGNTSEASLGFTVQ